MLTPRPSLRGRHPTYEASGAGPGDAASHGTAAETEVRKWKKTGGRQPDWDIKIQTAAKNKEEAEVLIKSRRVWEERNERNLGVILFVLL